MVHKVTMDTVKIITSSVSGMTNVSPLLAQQFTMVEPMAPVYTLKTGEEWACHTLHFHLSHSRCLQHLGAWGFFLFHLPELFSFKTQFQS